MDVVKRFPGGGSSNCSRTLTGLRLSNCCRSQKAGGFPPSCGSASDGAAPAGCSLHPGQCAFARPDAGSLGPPDPYYPKRFPHNWLRFVIMPVIDEHSRNSPGSRKSEPWPLRKRSSHEKIKWVNFYQSQKYCTSICRQFIHLRNNRLNREQPIR
jgi:hypothetical protein